MRIGIILNNSLMESEGTRTELWTRHLRYVTATLHCTWRSSALSTELHGW